MDIKALFPNMSLIWTRWSAYDIIRWTDMGVEKEYIVPARGAEQITYDCTERTEALVESTILIGEVIAKKKSPTVMINSLCIDFAVHFGLLGQMVGTEPAPMVRQNNMAPIYYPLNSKMYGEELSYLKDCFEKIYRHFTLASGFIFGVGIGDPQDKLYPVGPYGTINYRVTSGRTPQIIWGVDRLEDVLKLAYSLMVTSEKPALRVCKNCKRIYYNSHAKSEFCGARCRNQYNVKMYRERKG